MTPGGTSGRAGGPPSIAVVVPVRDGAATIAEALESVLGQSVQPDEVVVVDDGSTDGTLEVLSRFVPAVRVYEQLTTGAGPARNAGVARTSAPWIAFLDADDRWVPDALERLAAPLVADPALDVVLGRQRLVPARLWAAALAGTVTERLEERPGAGPGSALVRRTVFEAAGGFAIGWQVGEFVDWHLRAVDQGARVVRIDNVVQWRRVHGANTVIARRDAYGDYARIIKAALDRRRAAGGGAG
jgi:glycosyltransferase involved in cell wall biosynthesis